MALSAVSIIWGPKYAAWSKSETEERTTLQTYIERGASAFNGDEAKDVVSFLPYESISLQRTGCMVGCPVYVVTFFRDGRATLVADNWPSKGKSKYTGQIYLGDFARLTQVVTLAKNSTEHSYYGGEWTDASSAIVRAEGRGWHWQVRNYGNVAPVEVWALEMALDRIKEEMEWVPADQAGA